MDVNPGKYSHLVPTERHANLVWRKRLIEWVTAQGEEASVHLARRNHVWAMCQEDPIFYSKAFVWTYDPRVPSTSLPFILYEYQEKSLKGMLEALGSEDVVLEKSRDMGLSWLCSLMFEWAWHFKSQMLSFLLVSRKEDLVDKKGDMKSLMARLDFILERQPKWLLPNYGRRLLHLINNDTGSTIDGESTTGEVARGDRRTAILLDEFAKVEQDYAVLKATRDATASRIFLSTPAGAVGAFYDMRCKPGIRKFKFHWSIHPDKSKGLFTDETGKLRSPWYDAECERCVHPSEIAQELDIDYHASDSQFFDEAAITAAGKKVRDSVMTAYPIFDAAVAKLEGIERHRQGELRLWAPYTYESGPPDGKKFAIGCDIAQGTGATPSVASIGDLETGEKIGEVWTTTRKPHEFASLVVALCRWFNNAFLIWEVNGPGTVFTDQVIDLGYQNVYRRQRIKDITMKTRAYGWHSTRDTKAKLLGAYRKSLTEGTITIYTKESLDECRSYVFSLGGEAVHARQRAQVVDGAAARENHGDRVIADALLSYSMNEVTSHLVSKKPTPLDPPVGSFAHRRKMRLEAAKRKEDWW